MLRCPECGKASFVSKTVNKDHCVVRYRICSDCFNHFKSFEFISFFDLDDDSKRCFESGC